MQYNCFMIFVSECTAGLLNLLNIPEKSMTIQEISTIVEEPSTLDITTRSRRSETVAPTPKETPDAEPVQPEVQTSNAQDLFANTFSEAVVDMPPEPTLTNQQIDYDEGPPSIAPFSVPPPSVAPPSVAPPSVAPTATAPVSFLYLRLHM